MNRWTSMKREGPRTCIAWAALVAAVLWAGAPLGASTFLHTPFPELVRGADSVITGRVLSVSSFWDEEGIVIVSEAAVFVEEQIAGEGPTVAIVRTWGGTVAGFTVDAIGFPRFRVGERAVLFLNHQADGTERIFGFQEGHYRLHIDRDGVERAYPTVDAGAHWVTKAGQEAARPAKPEALDSLRQRVQAIADDAKGSR